MANILEYLDWRGDVPFSVDPFNDVDNLILSEIAYTDFEGILTQDEVMTFTDAARLYFEVHTEQEINDRTTFFKLAPIVLKKAAENARFKDVKISGYMSIVSSDRDEQIAAVTFTLPDDSCYVAFRGTDNTLVGWKEDFNLSFMLETSGQRRAVEYINFYFKGKKKNLMIGGHSKGGNFAVYSAAFCDKSVKKYIKTIYSNDGPGFRDEIIEKEGYKEILPKITSILPEESVVGVLLSNKYNNYYIKSSAKGLSQHDPMTWMVSRNEFVKAASRGEASILIDKAMVNWLATMSDEDREIFTDFLFSTLDSTGVKTLSELSDGGIKAVSEIMKSIKDLPHDKQQELSSMVKRFIKISRETIVSDWKEKSGINNKVLLITKNEADLETKQGIRTYIGTRRKSLSPRQVALRSNKICNKLLDMKCYKDAEIILAYMSIRNEVKLNLLIKDAISKGKKVYIPKVLSKTEMQFYLYDGNFVEGMYKIKEPANCTEENLFNLSILDNQDITGKVLVILPGTAYDRNFNRIGYGGGYYDRYISKLTKYPLTRLSVCYDFQIIDKIPAEKHDIKPNIIVTEKQILQ